MVEVVTAGTWASDQGLNRGDELVEVQGTPVSQYTPSMFADALQNRPLHLKMKRMELNRGANGGAGVDASDAAPFCATPRTDCTDVVAVAGADVKVLGFRHSAWPPPVYITKLVRHTWCTEKGFNIGDEILEVNGISVSSLTFNQFVSVLRRRPLSLKIRTLASLRKSLNSTSEDDGNKPVQKVVEAGVLSLGLRFNAWPPPMCIERITPGTWGAEQAFCPGDEVLEVGGISVNELTADTFRSALRTRPVSLKVKLNLKWTRPKTRIVSQVVRS